MPEGPETHHLADRLGAALVDKPLHEVTFLDPTLKPCEKKLKGRKVEDVQARGKAMLTYFDNGLTLYTHSHLFGHWRIEDTAREKPSAAPPRVRLQTQDLTVKLFAAPKVEIWPTVKIETHPFLAKLGPDVLDPAVTAEDFIRALDEKRFRNRPLAVLLLDQAFAAGMGNYLRSEVLFAARLSPLRKPAELGDDEARRLAWALLDVPRRSYRAKIKGPIVSTGKDYLATTKKTFRFEVFEREGDPCPDCGGPIVQQRLASRRLYWCPRCQR